MERNKEEEKEKEKEKEKAGGEGEVFGLQKKRWRDGERK